MNICETVSETKERWWQEVYDPEAENERWQSKAELVMVYEY